jgi:hypothetical protein
VRDSSGRTRTPGGVGVDVAAVSGRCDSCRERLVSERSKAVVRLARASRCSGPERLDGLRLLDEESHLTGRAPAARLGRVSCVLGSDAESSEDPVGLLVPLLCGIVEDAGGQGPGGVLRLAEPA